MPKPKTIVVHRTMTSPSTVVWSPPVPADQTLAVHLHDTKIQDRPRVRTIASVWSEEDDPYVIGHANPAMLDDDELNKRWKAWCAEHDASRLGLDQFAEVLEAFLEHLETEGYFGFWVSDATITLA